MLEKSNISLFDLILTTNKDEILKLVKTQHKLFTRSYSISSEEKAYVEFLKNFTTVYDNIEKEYQDYIKNPFMENTDMIIHADFEIFKYILPNTFLIYSTNNLELDSLRYLTANISNSNYKLNTCFHSQLWSEFLSLKISKSCLLKLQDKTQLYFILDVLYLLTKDSKYTPEERSTDIFKTSVNSVMEH